MEDQLTRRTLHGVSWSYATTVGTIVVQLGSTAVLARALGPAAFGLIAMANIALRFGQYFSQMGVAQAIVQRKVLEVQHLRAGFWLSSVNFRSGRVRLHACGPTAGRSLQAAGPYSRTSSSEPGLCHFRGRRRGNRPDQARVALQGPRSSLSWDRTSWDMASSESPAPSPAGECGVLVAASLSQSLVGSLSALVISRVADSTGRERRYYVDLLTFGSVVSLDDLRGVRVRESRHVLSSAGFLVQPLSDCTAER